MAVGHDTRTHPNIGLTHTAYFMTAVILDRQLKPFSMFGNCQITIKERNHYCLVN